MIPVSITVEGFLSYREPQTACFEGHTLWMLAGANGSGKSSLFDGITYALFGKHRAGSDNAHQLVNKDSDKLRVEFEFKLDDGHSYRAHRTLTRQRGRTCRIRQKVGEDEWREVDGSSSVGGMNEWVVQHVGIDYNTFVFSVMLLQGKSNELLEKKPAQRHEALGKIVGLDHYKQLYKRAVEKRNHFKGEEARTKSKLEGSSAVEEAQIKAAIKEKADLQTRISEREAASNNITAILPVASRWEDLRKRSEEKQKECERLNEASHNAPAIHKQYEELQLLQNSLPRLTDWARAWQQHSAFQNDHQRLVDDNTGEEDQVRQVESKLAEHQSAINGLKELKGKCAKELDSLSSSIEKWKGAAPWLQQFVDYRTCSRSALRIIETHTSNLRQCEEEHGCHLKAETTEMQVAQARKTCKAVRKDSVEARIRCEVAQENWDRFSALGDASDCPHCGQQLLPEHRASETARLTDLLEKARSLAEQQKEHFAVKSKELEAVEDHRKKWEKRRDQLKHEIDGLRSSIEKKQDNHARAETSCEAAFQKLPGNLQEKITATSQNVWSCTNYPSDADLIALKQHQNDEESRRDELKKEDEKLSNRVNVLHEKIRKGQNQLDQHKSCINGRKQEIAGILGKLESLNEQFQQHWQQLPAAWQEWEPDFAQSKIEGLTSRQQELESQNIEARSAEIKRASESLARLTQESNELKQDIEKIPTEARRTSATVSVELDQINAKLDQDRAECKSASDKLSSLRLQQKNYKTAEEEYKHASRQHYLWKEVAKHLSRDGLQRALVRKAEEQITQYANATLDRMSAGEMSMELQRHDDDDGNETAFELTVRSAASQQPLLVPFLSGSQKFRVSVALSLGIGQYASRNSRPVQAVVIDEGFGCLDTENRQVMISEIQSLQDQLQRIILVSHQEEFTDAFKHGYQVQLNEQGASELLEFHR